MACLLLSGAVQQGEAKVTLSALISDGMVLQRDREITIRGTAEPGEPVAVRFLGKSYRVKADKEGNWSASLPPAPAGGPYIMLVNEIEVRNILIGDVWLCSGQSNMELPVSRVMERFHEEVGNYSNPMIRHLKVPLSYDFHGPKKEIPAAIWQETTPENARSFSAVAYFFARELFESTGVPIGLVNASVGGSPAEAWISEEGLRAFPHHLNERDIWRDNELVESVKRLDHERRDAWHRVLFQQDEGLNNNVKWYEPGYDDNEWEKVDLFDASWGSDGLNPINGVHWFRKTVLIPSHLAGKSALLRLGCIVDADSVFINGTFVGTTGYQYPPRSYPVPEGLLKEGENSVTVRLISYSGCPGFVEEKPYLLRFHPEETPQGRDRRERNKAGKNTSPKNSPEELSLEGEWNYRLGTRMPSLPGETFFQYKPTGLYNAMIAPLEQTAFKGVLWYQGESNVGRHNEYAPLMEALISDWRTRWNQPKLPFLIVQLANFMQDPPYPSESGWAALREVQRKLTKEIPNTGLAVTIDIGDLLPVDELKGFAIAGDDGKYVWAKAVIEGDKVAVWNDSVPNPVSVRYAWGNNPEGVNLRNRQGLPASPFEAKLYQNGEPYEKEDNKK